MNNSNILEGLKKKLIEKIDINKDISDEELNEIISQMVSEEYEGKKISVKRKMQLTKDLYNSIRGLDILQNILDDGSVTEIMVNGPDKIFVEEFGKLYRYPGSFSSGTKLEDIIQNIVGRANKRVNEASPIADTRLPDGSRVNVVLNPIAVNGPVLTIRKFPMQAITMKDLIRMNSISREAASFLKELVIAGYNIFISGGTGSGKTTFLNALSEFIPEDERIITIEDSAELQIRGIDNLVSLECRPANTEGENEVTMRDLIKSSLRMRPTRIIVGEVRGAEASDMLSAMNTGHDGSLSTGHANSPEGMLTRLETMVIMGADIPLAAVKRQIASALDIIVHLGRMRDGSRKVKEITEVLDVEGDRIRLNPLYKLTDQPDKYGEYYLERTENDMVNTAKLYNSEVANEVKGIAGHRRVSVNGTCDLSFL